MSIHRICFFVVLALTLLFAAACETKSASDSMAASQKAVIVSGGNGGSSVVFIDSSDPDNPTIMASAGATICPDCKAAAIKYFKTGVLDPKCPTCGATRTAINVVPPTIGHN